MAARTRFRTVAFWKAYVDFGYASRQNSKEMFEWVKTYESIAIWLEGIALVLIFVWDRLDSRKQHKETLAQLEISQKQVEAIIAENRPWLLVQKAEGSGERIQPPYLEPAENMTERMSHCILFIKNYGRTPAKALGESAMLQLGDSPAQPPDISGYRIEALRDNPYTFPQGEAIPIQAVLTPLGFITQVDRDAVLQGRKFLWLCGSLKYRDTFERKDAITYETRFCYLWETRTNAAESFWRLAGPSECNKAT